MGLDSIELLMNFEDFFQIDIPDPEAAKINTPQNTVDAVLRYRSLDSSSIDLEEELFKKIKATLKELDIDTSTYSMHTSLQELFPSHNFRWTWLMFRAKCDLALPPDLTRRQRIAEKGIFQLLSVLLKASHLPSFSL